MAIASLKALTVSQPFADLIADGTKFVENRVWSTSYRGPLAIHAGKGSKYLSKSELQNYQRGVVVAVCRVIACVNMQEIAYRRGNDRAGRPATNAPTWDEISRHKHTEGPWCWILADVVKLVDPVACSGSQGLFSLQGRLLERIAEQVRGKIKLT